MNKDKELLSDITVHNKYAKFLKEENRRESWTEILDRNKAMHKKRYVHVAGMSRRIDQVYDDFVLTKKILPSMRSLQFGGRAIEMNNARMYNCAFMPVDNIHAFSEAMFLLLGGTGVGYSVQSFNIDKISSISKPNYKRNSKYLVQDSIIGWADAIKILMKSYTNTSKTHINFDLSDIREKGALLVTAGGKAPGPEPLRICLVKIEAILREKNDGEKLNDIECHRIMCFIADAVLAGGIRRAAMISLFDKGSDAMLNCKSGPWWETMPELGRANNSAVLERHTITQEEFNFIWKRIEASGAGEPGVYFTNNKTWGTNPCCEIGLKPNQFCNLTEINMATVVDQEDFNERSSAAAFIGTLQAGYTDFHYLREIWKETTEEDALLGVSMTGIASKTALSLSFEMAAEYSTVTNRSTAGLIGVNHAARITAVKPAGTTSLVVGSSSGIHAWHADYYIRRMRLGKNESLYKYLEAVLPADFIEDEFFDPKGQAVLSMPQKAPEGATTRQESALDLLERVKKITKEWVTPGHFTGENSHNVSCTVSVKPDEWDLVGKWMWDNRDYYNGLAVMPEDGGTYKQTPFEDCTKEVYENMMDKLSLLDIDLTKVLEEFDETTFSEIVACAGGACEIK
jgi:ribonucleoside-triphosphate reductase